jgi:hypothetical protein
METPSWKHLLAVASFLALHVQLVVRLLVPDYVEHSDAETGYFVAGWIIVVAFFYPFLWYRKTVGYVAGVLFGLLGVGTSIAAMIVLVAPGEIPGEGLYMLIPALILGLLLIVGSVLAWRER